MKTVTFDVASINEVKARARAAMSGKRQGERVSFASPELMFSILTPRRWEIIRSLASTPPMSIRSLARRLGRDVKGVHGDVHALLTSGVLRKEDDGISFPYDTVRVEFSMRAA